MNMNISCRIANANTQCGRITNPPERANRTDYFNYLCSVHSQSCS